MCNMTRLDGIGPEQTTNDYGYFGIPSCQYKDVIVFNTGVYNENNSFSSVLQNHMFTEVQ